MKKTNEYTLAVRSKISRKIPSKLIFASCVWYSSDRSYCNIAPHINVGRVVRTNECL